MAGDWWLGGRIGVWGLAEGFCDVWRVSDDNVEHTPIPRNHPSKETQDFLAGGQPSKETQDFLEGGSAF